MVTALLKHPLKSWAHCWNLRCCLTPPTRPRTTPTRPAAAGC